MSTPLLIGAVILGGISLGWLFHHRSVRQMVPILRRLAIEVNGAVRSRGPFVLPQLVFSHSGTDVEVSSATTGTSGESIRYTYAVFKGLAPKNFEFRILPRSLQTVGDEWLGFKKPTAADLGKLKTHLTIYTNNDGLIEALLSERIQADLLFWAEGERTNRLSDIRNHEGDLIYAVTGELNSYEDFKLLLDSACRFSDAVKSVVSS